MSGRENAETKSRRYLVEGRLLVEHVDERTIRATCRGGGTTYALGHDGAAWYCRCPALGRCSHLIGLQLVTVRVEARAA